MMPWCGVYHEVVYPGEKELAVASPAPKGMKVGREGCWKEVGILPGARCSGPGTYSPG